MSNAFTNFLSGVAGGIFGPGPYMRDYQHADRLYVRNTYARAPKVGFLFFVSFSINRVAVNDPAWIDLGMKDVGFLVKRVDLPKFKITTETLNQYNRKTVVQTKLNYSEITLDFHDDNSDITNNFWKNYYRYYYADSTYGGDAYSSYRGVAGQWLMSYSDTKYSDTNYSYGFDNYQRPRVPFFSAIDIYVMHQHKFTQMTLVNPMVTDWSHDTVDQEQSTKILTNKMSLAYENVIYNHGNIVKGSAAGQFTARYYDTSPSPLSVAGNGTNTLFGAGGVLAGASSVLDNLSNGNLLAAAIQASTTVRNARQINKASLLAEGNSILGNTLNNIAATGNQPGGIGSALQTSAGQSGLGGVNNLGITLFNPTPNTTIQATPSLPSANGGARSA